MILGLWKSASLPRRLREKLVAREGSAPSTSGCRPDAMLFHHRAKGARVSDPQHIRKFGGLESFYLGLQS